MTCHSCRIDTVKAGKQKDGSQRYKCQQCGKRYTEPKARMFGEDSRLPEQKTLMILQCLLEGNSVPVRDVQADEIWSFIGCKEKARTAEHDSSFGDCYTFVAIERDTKLVLNVAIGKRDQTTTNVFVEGLRQATQHGRFQITTDGFAPYRSAVETSLGDRLDFAQLIKVYRATAEGERRYSPAEVISTQTVVGIGQPDPARICTSHVRTAKSQHADGHPPTH